MIPKISVRPDSISVPVLLWENLNDAQKQQAENKYFPDAGEEWESAEEFFTCMLDCFIEVDGEVFNLDIEAVAMDDYKSELVLCAGCAPGFTARYLESTVKRERVLFVRYANNLPNNFIHVFAVRSENV